MNLGRAQIRYDFDIDMWVASYPVPSPNGIVNHEAYDYTPEKAIIALKRELNIHDLWPK